MIITTRFGADYYECPETDETYYFPHIPPVNNMIVTIAYQVNDKGLFPYGEMLPFDYEDKNLTDKFNRELCDYIGWYLTLDTDTGVTKFYDRKHTLQHELTILPYALNLIKENIKADPTGLDGWGTDTDPLIEEQQGA